MRFSERLYRSPLGRTISALGRLVGRFHQPFMVYGFMDPKSGRFRKYTRLSSTVVVMNKSRMSIGDFVWVGHYSILDCTEGLELSEGVQIAFRVGIFTHGSERSVRLLGRDFVHLPSSKRIGYTRGPVRIGEYSYLGSGSVVLPGICIGKGCLIGAGTVVTRDVPDYAIVTGVPGEVRGNTFDLDRNLIEMNPELLNTYFDRKMVAEWPRFPKTDR